MVHVAQTNSAATARTSLGRSAAVPPHAPEVGARAPAPPVRASMAPHRAVAGSGAEIDKAIPVEAMVASMVHLLHHRGIDIDRRPRLRERGSGCGWRRRQHAEGNQAGCQREFSNHGSIPHCEIAGAHAPSVHLPARKVTAGHLNNGPTRNSGAVHFKRFGQICGG